MSFNRSGYIGRAPGDSAITIARKSYEPTGVQTDFTFSAGYVNGYCDVYLNGVKLIDEKDYTATNGSTVGLNTAANSGDVVEIIAYKAFNLGVPLSDITGDLDITGSVSASSSITANNGTGGIYGAFVGDGSGLTGVASTDYIITGTAATFNSQVKVLNLNVTGITSTTSFNVGAATTIDGGGINVTGVITATGFGPINVDATTDSTSSTTGALIVDGGVGIAKNVYIGAGLSVAGTLTYEDVTNVDSVGLITAKSGVKVTGGQIQVGSAFSVGPAGVVTATSYYGDGSNLSNITSTTINNNADNRLITGSGTANTLNGESTLTYDGASLKVGSGITMAATAGVATFADSSGNGGAGGNRLDFGSEGDLKIYHDGTNNYILNDAGASFYIQNDMGGNSYENNIVCTPNAAVQLYYNGQLKFQTTNDGTVTTGIATATGGHITGGGEFKVGTGVTIASTSGVSTFSRGVTFKDADVTFSADNYDITFIHDANCVRWNDDAQAQFGTGQDLRVYHDGSHGYINETTGDLKLRYGGDDRLRINVAGAVVTGIMTATTVEDSKGDVRRIIYQNKTSGYVLVASDAGKAIHISTGGVTINNSLFTEGDAVTIINNSGSNQTITQGTGVTLYDTGDDGSTGNKTLKGRGMCTVWFASASVGYISGNFA